MKTLSGIIYRRAVKPALFLFPADDVHEVFLKLGDTLGRSSIIRSTLYSLWGYRDESLKQNISELEFINPVGLSAGFDYNADLVEVLPSIGFGFHTTGTLTLEPYAGNPRPMLARLPKSKSLLVNKGFKNEGVTEVLKKLKPNQTDSLRGVSIGATNKPYKDFEEMIENLVGGFKIAEENPYFDYYELNISCPNLQNIHSLDTLIDSPHGLTLALERLSTLHIKRPVFIKMPLEKTLEDFRALADSAVPFNFIHGLIISNLAKDRSNSALHKGEVASAGRGNFSGKPVESKSNELISFAYKNYKERFTIIGVGGVFTAEDAYKKIKLGASLVELITGMVYMGPQQIGLINRGLAELLKKDGYKNISEAVGRESQ